MERLEAGRLGFTLGRKFEETVDLGDPVCGVTVDFVQNHRETAEPSFGTAGQNGAEVDQGVADFRAVELLGLFRAGINSVGHGNI